MKESSSGIQPRAADLCPLVSIIVPSFNQGAYIRDTIQSCLDQDYRPIEIIVIDGASTDNTIEVLNSFGDIPELMWISEPDSGVVEAVNKGFDRASGEFGAIQSSDDFYLPGAVVAGVEQLIENPDCGFVYGDIIKIDEQDQVLMESVLAPFSLENVLSLRTWIPQPACFFRMELARELNGWRESVPYAADTDLWYRMLLKSSARKFDRFVSKRRMHSDQRDTQGAKIIADYTQMVDDWFDLFHAPRSLRPAADVGIMRTQRRYGGASVSDLKMVERFPALGSWDPHLIVGRTVRYGWPKRVFRKIRSLLSRST